MSRIRLNGISVQNYRSFGDRVTINFPRADYKKPTAIVGYNNAGKTNLLNAILYGVTEKYVNKDTFSIDDFHNRDMNNIPRITSWVESSVERKENGKNAALNGFHRLNVEVDGFEIESASMESYNDKEFKEKNWQAYGASKYFNIFYINFHEIKKEISTKKTSWGNLTSFLAKHISYIIKTDGTMIDKRVVFQEDIKKATGKVLVKSNLEKFIKEIQENYSKNLRNNNCTIDFGLPDYEEIFLEMVFKIGLNGDSENLVPVEHFGDGYISMFVMAIIQAIAESNVDDKCLFLFEEPESFLHENHQEYFYKMVLCGLAENGHQVIYTTHSDKMLDIFDTRGIVRIEFDDVKKCTTLKYNNYKNTFENRLKLDVIQNGNIISEIRDYNNYIKIIEPNLNRIIFSKKVVLVEGPNDLLVYKELIRRKVEELTKNKKFAETFLTFSNISIIPHHGKITAIILIRLCKHLGLEYYVINDFDFSQDYTAKFIFDNENDFKKSDFYITDILEIKELDSRGTYYSVQTMKAMMTTNWKLRYEAGNSNIHFNIPKLESLIGYDSNDKDSCGIWDSIIGNETISEKLFPRELSEFLDIKQAIGQ